MVYRSMSHINEEVSRIKELFPIMGTALLAGLLATLLLIHLQILRPLSLLSQALRTIRSGHSISDFPGYASGNCRTYSTFCRTSAAIWTN